MLPKFELSPAGEQIEVSGKGGQTMHKYYFEPVKVEMPNRYEVEVCGKQSGVSICSLKEKSQLEV